MMAIYHYTLPSQVIDFTSDEIAIEIATPGSSEAKKITVSIHGVDHGWSGSATSRIEGFTSFMSKPGGTRSKVVGMIFAKDSMLEGFVEVFTPET